MSLNPTIRLAAVEARRADAMNARALGSENRPWNHAEANVGFLRAALDEVSATLHLSDDNAAAAVMYLAALVDACKGDASFAGEVRAAQGMLPASADAVPACLALRSRREADVSRRAMERQAADKIAEGVDMAAVRRRAGAKADKEHGFVTAKLKGAEAVLAQWLTGPAAKLEPALDKLANIQDGSQALAATNELYAVVTSPDQALWSSGDRRAALAQVDEAVRWISERTIATLVGLLKEGEAPFAIIDVPAWEAWYATRGDDAKGAMRSLECVSYLEKRMALEVDTRAALADTNADVTRLFELFNRTADLARPPVWGQRWTDDVKQLNREALAKLASRCDGHPECTTATRQAIAAALDIVYDDKIKTLSTLCPGERVANVKDADGLATAAQHVLFAATWLLENEVEGIKGPKLRSAQEAAWADCHRATAAIAPLFGSFTLEGHRRAVLLRQISDALPGLAKNPGVSTYWSEVAAQVEAAK